MSRNIVALYEHTLTSTDPYYEANFTGEGCYNVIEIDIQNHPSIDARNLNYEWFHEHVFCNLGGTVDGIIMMPPCTDFTVSCNRLWEQKDLDGTTDAALELLDIGLEMVEVLKPDWWVLENPVGRLPRLRPELGKPVYFHPWEYAGYTDVDLTEAHWLLSKKPGEFTEEDIEKVKCWNLYNKKTGLWGDFSMPKKKPVFPIRTSNQGSWLQALGSCSIDTKNARSVTPSGFAKAFFNSNK